MDLSDKVRNASLFLEGKVDVICATDAFGMRIDKKDVRFVIHYALPSSFEDMVHEPVRVGRDGEDSTCIILFKFSDRMNILRNISCVTSKDNQITMRKSLNEVTMTLSNKTKCRQQSIAAYFEEDEGEPRMLCDNCQKPDNGEENNMAADAQQLIDCLRHMTFSNQQVKVQGLSQTYMGSKARSILENKFDRCAYYGAGKHTFKSLEKVTKFIEHLIIKGFIEEVLTKSIDLKHATVHITVGNISDMV